MKTTLLSAVCILAALAMRGQLLFTEIMYNAPGTGGNDLEFIEIYNAGSDAVALNGYQVVDAGNFTFTFPEMSLDEGGIVLLATNKDVADVFYGTTFLDIAGAGNFLGNGGELIQLKDDLGVVILAVNYDDAAPWTTAPDGNGPSLELLSSTFDSTDGASWTSATNLAGNNAGSNIFASPGTFTENLTPTVAFADGFGIVSEDGTSITIELELSAAGNSASFVTVSAGNFATATEGDDFLFEEMVVTFDANTQTTASFDIPVLDNNDESIDKLFTLVLSNAVNCDLGELTEFVVFIQDDEETVPAATEALDLQFVASYVVDEEGSAEIVAYHKERKRLFVMNSTATKLEIIDFSDPHNMSTISTIDLSAYGLGGTSVACNSKYVAVTVDGFDNEPGTVVIFTWNGVFRNQLTVGHLPDMLTFTPNNRFLVIANEAEPTSDYSFDPEGTISVINMTGNVANLDDEDVVHINFNNFDEQLEELQAQGVRIFGFNATVSQDFEPEFITISSNSKKAWVTLQENNAIAEVDLQNFEVLNIMPLGVKDYSLEGNSLDASDVNAEIHMTTWAGLKGMYLPDAVSNYKVNGVTYLVTANEGDQREYDPIDEDVRLSSGAYVLDPVAFPDAALLKKSTLLGRLVVTPYSGDTDGDGDFDEIHTFGARSFSIWNAETGALVYDSGNEIEKITAADPVFGSLFNASNDNNNFKNRSDNKGPEPEGITVASIGESFYAFIALERSGGVMVYDITNPEAAQFVCYRNSRALGEDEGGDLGPEGIIYIDPLASPMDTALVVIANEISATISVYSINNVTEAENKMAEAGNENETVFPSTALKTTVAQLHLYPNPANTDRVYMSEPVSYTLYDSEGKYITSGQHKASMDVSAFAPGLYVVVTTDGRKENLIID